MTRIYFVGILDKVKKEKSNVVFILLTNIREVVTSSLQKVTRTFCSEGSS